MVMISDLDYLTPIAPSHMPTGAAGTAVSAIGAASGETAYVTTTTQSRVRQLPRGGSISISWGRAFGVATDPVDAEVFVEVTGSGEGTVMVERYRSRTLDLGRFAIGRAGGIVVAFDPPG